MPLALIGIKPHTTLFSRIALRENDGLPGFYRKFNLQFSDSHCFVLASPLRFEIYATVSSTDVHASLVSMIAGVLQDSSDDTQKPLCASDIFAQCYFAEGTDASAHLHACLCAMDAFATGCMSGKIDAQALKNAVRTAQELDLLSEDLSLLAKSALSLNNLVYLKSDHSELDILTRTTIEIAQHIFDHIDKKSVLMFGANEFAKNIAYAFSELGIPPIKFALIGSFLECDIAKGYGVKLPKQDDVASSLRNSDIIIVSSHPQNIVISTQMMRDAMRARKGKPIFLLSLEDIDGASLVDKQVGTLDGVYLYTSIDIAEVSNKFARLREQDGFAASLLKTRLTNQNRYSSNSINSPGLINKEALLADALASLSTKTNLF